MERGETRTIAHTPKVRGDQAKLLDSVRWRAFKASGCLRKLNFSGQSNSSHVSALWMTVVLQRVRNAGHSIRERLSVLFLRHWPLKAIEERWKILPSSLDRVSFEVSRFASSFVSRLFGGPSRVAVSSLMWRSSRRYVNGSRLFLWIFDACIVFKGLILSRSRISSTCESLPSLYINKNIYIILFWRSLRLLQKIKSYIDKTLD